MKSYVKALGIMAVCLGGLAACTVTTTQVPTGGTGPQSAISAPAMNAAFGQLLNAERARAGLSPVAANGTLERIAAGHAQDMEQRDFFSHTSSNGQTLGQRTRAGGYGYCSVAENIARGQRSVEEVHQSWMTSSGHRANNLSGTVTEYGLARVDDTWVLVLASGGC